MVGTSIITSFMPFVQSLLHALPLDLLKQISSTVFSFDYRMTQKRKRVHRVMAISRFDLAITSPNFLRLRLYPVTPQQIRIDHLIHTPFVLFLGRFREPER